MLNPPPEELQIAAKPLQIAIWLLLVMFIHTGLCETCSAGLRGGEVLRML